MKPGGLDLPYDIMPIGLRLSYGNQWYEIIDADNDKHIVSWQTHCAECNAVFEFKTGFKMRIQFNRRCGDHRKPGVPVR